MIDGRVYGAAYCMAPYGIALCGSGWRYNGWRRIPPPQEPLRQSKWSTAECMAPRTERERERPALLLEAILDKSIRQ
jgi:hypothetical protein